MIQIVDLLNEKNHYLEKFYSLNENELGQFLRGNFDNLEKFYDTREKIIEIIRYIDAKIDKINLSLKNITPEDKIRAMVQEALHIKDQYVAKIMEQDLQILSCIDSAKSEIIKELQVLKKNKKAVGGYKTKNFNNRLNEEA